MRRISNINPGNLQGSSVNAGLWYDKYLASFDVEVKKQHLHHVAAMCKTTPAYEHYYARWSEMLDIVGATSVTLQTQSRLIVGIGEASVRDIGIMLHHTYAVPFIPGSSLKGLAAAYARSLPGWDATSESYVTLFGNGDASGVVDFLDALWVPDERVTPLSVDIVNVHYQSYYTNFSRGTTDQDIQKLFMEAPVPNFFVCVKPKVDMLIAVNGPEVWVRAALTLIVQALDAIGIGAKTRAGYGRMRVPTAPVSTPLDAIGMIDTSVDQDELVATNYIQLNLQIRPNDIPAQLPNKVEQLIKEDLPVAVKQKVAQKMREMADSAKISTDKKWYQKLLEMIQQ